MEELTRRGRAAAIALGGRLGLPAAEPVVLSSRGNLLLHFAPAPVVGRVATLTAWSRRDPFAWLAREVAVAGYVAARGGPAVSPTRRADPGPHPAGRLRHQPVGVRAARSAASGPGRGRSGPGE